MSVALTFVASPPGFAPALDFALDELDGTEGLFTLSAWHADLRLYVLDAAIHAPHYHPEINDEQASELGLVDAADALVYLVAKPSKTGVQVNLLAPIVVNGTTGRSAQLILDDQDWPLQASLPLQPA
jgi:flagellar assembly factor FliW